MTIARTKITDLDTVSEARKIYESPDGGKTVYVREFGSDRKVLVKQDPLVAKRQQIAIRADRLVTILLQSETDITLRDALEQLEALYILKYTDDKNN